ncbi:MAG: HAMP domain-containing protein [Candidatus Competibacteraceae bacterium]|nr:MAG: HAMP domain-containing protein [Candidatus Competibacteraceae bacterium]
MPVLSVEEGIMKNGRNHFFAWLRHRPLQLNILLAFTALLVTTVVVIVSYTYRQNSATVLQISDDLIHQVTDTVIEKTINYLTPAVLMAQSSARIPGMADLSLVENPALERYGMALLALYPQLDAFFIGNERGDFIFIKRFADGGIGTQEIDRSLATPLRTWTYRDTAGHVTEVETTDDFTYDPRRRPWYEGAKKTGRAYWTDIYIFFTDQTPGITAAYPIHDDRENLVGVIGIDVTLNELSFFLETLRAGDNGVAFITNEQGQIVAYPRIDLARADGEGFRPVHISELRDRSVAAAYEAYITHSRSRFTMTSGGQRYIVSFTSIAAEIGRNWSIGVVVPEDDFVGDIKRTNQISLLISLIILFLSIVVAIFISRAISRPIVELARETRKIANLDLDNQLKISSPISEVQLLDESISAMKTGLQAFKRYVPADLVRQLIRTGEEARLGGDQRELTILFTDIANFTSRSEGMDAEGLMLQLSHYMGELATIIMSQQGTVDKYMGDGLMAFWGAPTENPDHAFYACHAVLSCRDRIAELNEQWGEQGRLQLPTRFGIHTGQTLVGNIGSTERMNYTVLGDSVNLASRLEAVNNIYGTTIIVSQATYHKVADRFYFRPLDTVMVKGIRQGVLLYELMGEPNMTPQTKIVLCRDFTAGYAAYTARDWSKASALFEDLAARYPSDTATLIYLTRCRAFQQSPPGPEWRPAVNLTPKPVDVSHGSFS